jgi:hypothetical protein
MTETVDVFLAHHGVKGMHWGHRKPSVSGAKNAASKSGTFVANHPAGVYGTAAVAYVAYRKKGKLAAAAVIATSIGAYELKKHYENDPAFRDKISAGKKAVNGTSS